MPDKNDKKRLSEHRDFILHIQKKEKRLPAKDVNITVMPMSFLIKDAHDLFLVIYRPHHLQNPPYPTLLHIRGTGFNTSARYYAYITCSHIAAHSGCQVIDLDHHLAPEYPYPRPFNDVYAAYKSVILHANFMQIDINKIAISGYSSGGNLAALVSIQAKNDNLPIAFQILISPILDLSRSLKKYLEFENKDSFPSSLMDWFITLYLQNNSNLFYAPQISPFWSNCLTGLPPTYFLFGEYDRFRSDSEVFYDKLNQLGLWACKYSFKEENHSAFWRNKQVVEVVSTQLKMGFNLTKIPRLPFSATSNEDLSPTVKFLAKQRSDQLTFFSLPLMAAADAASENHLSANYSQRITEPH